MRHPFALSALAVVIVGSIAWTACHDDGKQGDCTVGLARGCTCPDGSLGAEICMSSGVFGSCMCSDMAVPPEPDLSSIPHDFSQPADLAIPPDMACAPVANAKRVFVTSTTYNGDLKTAGSGTDGLDGADKLCQARADAVSLGGTWKAWLSSSTMDAISRITDVGPWYLPDRCDMVFASKSAISSGDPLIAINHDETDTVVMNVAIWTGTADDGSYEGDGCSDWTDGTSGAQAAVGTAAPGVFPGFWTSGIFPQNCDGNLRLLCFEQ